MVGGKGALRVQGFRALSKRSALGLGLMASGLQVEVSGDWHLARGGWDLGLPESLSVGPWAWV